MFVLLDRGWVGDPTVGFFGSTVAVTNVFRRRGGVAGTARGWRVGAVGFSGAELRRPGGAGRCRGMEVVTVATPIVGGLLAAGMGSRFLRRVGAVGKIGLTIPESEGDGMDMRGGWVISTKGDKFGPLGPPAIARSDGILPP